MHHEYQLVHLFGYTVTVGIVTSIANNTAIPNNNIITIR